MSYAKEFELLVFQELLNINVPEAHSVCSLTMHIFWFPVPDILIPQGFTLTSTLSGSGIPSMSVWQPGAPAEFRQIQEMIRLGF